MHLTINAEPLNKDLRVGAVVNTLSLIKSLVSLTGE